MHRHVASVMGELSSYPKDVMPHREPTPRLCSKASCNQGAFQTLTYVYADSEAVLGPLSAIKEPHSYDLCEHHAARLSPPVGWRLVRYRPYPEAV